MLFRIAGYVLSEGLSRDDSISHIAFIVSNIPDSIIPLVVALGFGQFKVEKIKKQSSELNLKKAESNEPVQEHEVIGESSTTTPDVKVNEKN